MASRRRTPESGDRPLSIGSSSIGKAKTSVGPSLPRNLLLSSAMAPSSTNNTDSSASPVSPSSPSTASANRAHRNVSTGWSLCSSAAKTSTATGCLPELGFAAHKCFGRRAVGRLVGVICRNDIGHYAVTDHVTAG